MSMMLGARGVSAEMNVTPLVDVLLVLLIIFMIAPRNDPWGLDAKVPQPSVVDHPAQPPDKTIVLEVNLAAEGEPALRLNHQPVAWWELSARLREIYKTRAAKVMFIHGGKEVEFGQVARAMDLAREADRGITIGLITQNILYD